MKRIYVTEEAYRALVQHVLSTRGSTRGISEVASQLILAALSQHAPGTASGSPPSAPEQQAEPRDSERPATPAQVEAIFNIAWEIASWSDVRDLLSKTLGFAVPDEPGELTVAQASKVIETLSRWNKRLPSSLVKKVKQLLREVASKEGVKPEEAAAKYNIPERASQLKRYHLELLEQLAGGETK